MHLRQLGWPWPWSLAVNIINDEGKKPAWSDSWNLQCLSCFTIFIKTLVYVLIEICQRLCWLWSTQVAERNCSEIAWFLADRCKKTCLVHVSVALVIKEFVGNKDFMLWYLLFCLKLHFLIRGWFLVLRFSWDFLLYCVTFLHKPSFVASLMLSSIWWQKIWHTLFGLKPIQSQQDLELTRPKTHNLQKF